MNVFAKNNDLPFLSSKRRPKEGKKHLDVNQQQTTPQAAKVLFTTKTIEEHERKSDTSEKQSVKMSALKPYEAELLAAPLDRCLAFGIYKPSYN